MEALISAASSRAGFSRGHGGLECETFYSCLKVLMHARPGVQADTGHGRDLLLRRLT